MRFLVHRLCSARHSVKIVLAIVAGYCMYVAVKKLPLGSVFGVPASVLASGTGYAVYHLANVIGE